VGGKDSDINRPGQIASPLESSGMATPSNSTVSSAAAGFLFWGDILFWKVLSSPHSRQRPLLSSCWEESIIQWWRQSDTTAVWERTSRRFDGILSLRSYGSQRALLSPCGAVCCSQRVRHPVNRCVSRRVVGLTVSSPPRGPAVVPPESSAGLRTSPFYSARNRRLYCSRSSGANRPVGSTLTAGRAVGRLLLDSLPGSLRGHHQLLRDAFCINGGLLA